MPNSGHRFISLLSRGSTVASTPVITALRFASMSMRFALRRGMMAVSTCRWESLQPLSVIGSHDICHGKIHSLTARWYTTTSLPLATRSHPRHRWILCAGLIMESTNLIREFVLGQDAGFAWHHLQLWAEFYETRFEVPRVGDADTFAYYFEAKYKFTPQLFGALRWNQQLFSNIPDGAGGQVHWSQDLWRIDAAAGYRFTSHIQLKLQYSFQKETTGLRDDNHLIAAQLTVRF